jgi:hypothetical protein
MSAVLLYGRAGGHMRVTCFGLVFLYKPAFRKLWGETVMERSFKKPHQRLLLDFSKYGLSNVLSCEMSVTSLVYIHVLNK